MIQKTCIKCKKDLPLSEFNISGRKRDGSEKRHSYCKKCFSEYSKDKYLENIDSARRRSREGKLKRQNIARRFIMRYLVGKKCMDCGYDNSLALQFDHVNPKKKSKNVSTLVKEGYALEKIKAEIGKCVIRCANCHQIKTAHQLGFYKVNMTNKPR